MKTCFKCRSTKPLSEYYAHPKTADRHFNKCKTCTRSDNKPSNGRATVVCLMCSRAFTTNRYMVRVGRALTCSYSCAGSRRTQLEIRGSLHPSWKGDNAGYSARHDWVRRWYGTPAECEHCGDTSPRVYEWSNVSGDYRRDRSDWQRLCRPCHRSYDRQVREAIGRMRLIK